MVENQLRARVLPRWRRDAHHRLHHQPVGATRHPRPPRRTDGTTAHRSRLRPAVMGTARLRGWRLRPPRPATPCCRRLARVNP